MDESYNHCLFIEILFQSIDFERCGRSASGQEQPGGENCCFAIKIILKLSVLGAGAEQPGGPGVTRECRGASGSSGEGSGALF